MTTFEEDTIQRCPHDRENPYVMVSSALIRDSSISPECRWLLIYLLSNAAGWNIKVKQVAHHVHGHMGRDRVYAIFNEACEAGYMQKKEGFGYCQYFISETPKFKKCLQLPENQDTDGQYTENQDALSKIKESKEISKEEGKPRPAASPPPQAAEISSLLFEAIKKIKPDYKPPNFNSWTREIDLMMRIDKRNIEDIKKIIEWLPTAQTASNGFNWNKNILSAESLRKQFDKLEIEMRKTPPKTSSDDLGLLKKLEARKDLIARKIIILGADYVEFPEVRDAYFKIGEPSFRDKVLNSLEKVGIKVNRST